jgi:hypothetical protein
VTSVVVLITSQILYDATKYCLKLTRKAAIICRLMLVSSPLLLNPLFWKQSTTNFDDRRLLLSFAFCQTAHNVLPLSFCGVLGDVPLLQHSFVLRFAAYVSVISIKVSKTLTYVLLKPCEFIVVITSESVLSSST